MCKSWVCALSAAFARFQRQQHHGHVDGIVERIVAGQVGYAELFHHGGHAQIDIGVVDIAFGLLLVLNARHFDLFVGQADAEHGREKFIDHGNIVF